MVSLVLIGFQFASTALTVTLNAVPAVCAAAVPVLPEPVPGAAVSPGASSCNFTKAPALTVIEGLVLAANVPAASLEVTVRVPAVLKVRLDKVRVPATRVRLPTVPPLSSVMAALASEQVIFTLGVALLTMFQLASTAFTVMPLEIVVPAVRALGLPVLPVAVPGPAVSPGNSSCSFTTG